MDIALLLVPGVPVLMILFLLAMERVEAGLSAPDERAASTPGSRARGRRTTRSLDGPFLNLGEDQRRDEEAVV